MSILLQTNRLPTRMPSHSRILIPTSSMLSIKTCNTEAGSFTFYPPSVSIATNRRFCREDALEAELAAASKATPSKNKKRTTATDAEITLPDHDGMLGPYDFDLDYQGRGIDSQQFAPEDFNLDLDLDAHLPGDDLRSQRAQSVEVGRDAPSSAARKSNRASSPLSSLNGAGGMDVDFDGGLGLDQSGADASAFASGADFDFEAGAGFDLGLDLDGQRSECMVSS